MFILLFFQCPGKKRRKKREEKNVRSYNTLSKLAHDALPEINGMLGHNILTRRLRSVVVRALNNWKICSVPYLRTPCPNLVIYKT